MLYRHIAVAVLASFLTFPVAAHNRGNVLIETRGYHPTTGIVGDRSIWVHIGWKYLFGTGQPLIYKSIPYVGSSGRTYAPSPNLYVFHSRNTVSWWDGKLEIYSEPGLGYTPIFHSDTELSEIVPMRNGNYLVAERWADRSRGAKLIEFNLQGIVAEHRFPEVVAMPLTANRVFGAMHIELLADQCSVLYTFGNDAPTLPPAVHRVNICTGQPQTEFASLLVDEYQGAIRQLPNGEVIVANGAAILQFNSEGSLLRTRQFPGVTHVALTPDGAAFWAAGAHQDKFYLRNFDPTNPVHDPPSIPFGNPEMQSLHLPYDVAEMIVIGEWRSGKPPERARAVRR